MPSDALRGLPCALQRASPFPQPLQSPPAAGRHVHSGSSAPATPTARLPVPASCDDAAAIALRSLVCAGGGLGLRARVCVCRCCGAAPDGAAYFRPPPYTITVPKVPLAALQRLTVLVLSAIASSKAAFDGAQSRRRRGAGAWSVVAIAVSSVRVLRAAGFISYRVSTDAETAEDLCYRLLASGLEVSPRGVLFRRVP